MPLYEYYCRDCNGVFELLRPTRESAKAQPCPECDDDAERIMPKQWAAFVFRDGYPRRIPDDGKFWHLGKKVSAPISGPSDGYSHPELMEPDDEPASSIEDIERYEVLREVKREHDLATGTVIHDVQMQQADEQMARSLRRRGGARFEQEKQRILRKVASEDHQARGVVAREVDAAVRASERRRRSEGDYVPPRREDYNTEADLAPRP